MARLRLTRERRAERARPAVPAWSIAPTRDAQLDFFLPLDFFFFDFFFLGLRVPRASIVGMS